MTVEARAAYSSSGIADMFVVDHPQGATLVNRSREAPINGQLTVQTVPLDEYFDEAKRIKLLKIDAEGAELEVFKGAERILREQSPLVVFECEYRHLASGSIQNVFSYLEAFGYEGGFIFRNRLLPLAAFDPAMHQSQQGERFWKKKDYCNNLVFAKPPREGSGRAALGRTTP